MWLWLLIQTALVQNPTSLGLSTNAFAAETSTGPTSTEEAQVLWTDGKTAFETENYSQAIILLQRLIDRYPGYSGYLEAHRYLGRSLFLAGEAEKSVAPLRYYVTSTGDRELGHIARIWLGDSYLKLGKFHEAYLLALEIEKGKSPSPRVRAESQFLKARSLIGTDEDRRARKVLDAVQAKAIVQTDSLLKSQSAEVSIILKIRECGKTPDPKENKLNELETQEAFNRKVLCLQEAMTQAKKVNGALGNIPTPDTSMRTTISAICDEIVAGFKAYNAAVRNPPSGSHPKSETPAQRKQYQLELIDHLEEGRAKAYSEALGEVMIWKSTSGPFTQIYQKLYSELEKLSKREP